MEVRCVKLKDNHTTDFRWNLLKTAKNRLLYDSIQMWNYFGNEDNKETFKIQKRIK